MHNLTDDSVPRVNDRFLVGHRQYCNRASPNCPCTTAEARAWHVLAVIRGWTESTDLVEMNEAIHFRGEKTAYRQFELDGKLQDMIQIWRATRVLDAS